MTDQKQEDRPETPTVSESERLGVVVDRDNLAAAQCLEEEYTVGVPLVRPKPELLSFLKLTGASGETFTKKEIVQHLQNYIRSRELYDLKNPSVVHCEKDPLRKVFNVDTFTVFEVPQFLSSNCTPAPDTCLKRKRRLVTRSLTHQPATVSKSESTSFTISLSQASPVISSSSDVYDHDFKTRKTVSAITLKQRKSSSSSAGSCRKKEKQSLNQSSLALSPREEQQNQSESAGHSQEESKQPPEEAKSTEGTQSSKKKRNRKRRRKSGRDGGISPGQATEPSDEPGPSSRKRGTSLSITYNDGGDNSAYPWYFQLQVEDNDNEKESEVLSIQDKTTATVHDSTDDLWFVEEESFAVEVHSDGEFSVEYDIQSDHSPLTESDVGSIKSGEGLLVVCKESDVEFFADYSDSDSEDTEFAEADKWMCLECKYLNLPLQRYCDMCWKLRPGWLPDVPSSAAKKTGNQLENSAKSLGCDKTGTEPDREISKPVSVYDAIKRSIADTADVDSGVGGLSSSFPSSQETVKSSQETPLSAIKRCEEKAPEQDIIPAIIKSSASKERSLFHDVQATEVRYTFSNFQTNVSPSSGSTESQTQDNSSSAAGKLPSTISDPCMICLSKPKSASLVHGSSGHQVCCFPCGKRLKRRGKVCPVCRRPIQKVIKNYIL